LQSKWAIRMKAKASPEPAHEDWSETAYETHFRLILRLRQLRSRKETHDIEVRVPASAVREERAAILMLGFEPTEWTTPVAPSDGVAVPGAVADFVAGATGPV
jgi:hypothetical protein